MNPCVMNFHFYKKGYLLIVETKARAVIIKVLKTQNGKKREGGTFVELIS